MMRSPYRNPWFWPTWLFVSAVLFTVALMAYDSMKINAVVRERSVVWKQLGEYLAAQRERYNSGAQWEGHIARRAP